MNCVICNKEVEKDEYLTFSSGEIVCKDCFENFKTNMSLSVKNPVLKEQIIDQIFDAAIPEIINKIQENCYNDLKKSEKNPEDFSEVMSVAFEHMCNKDYIQEYNQILMKHKMRFDVNGIIDMSEISYEGKRFQEKMREKSQECSLAMLNDESFYLLHKMEFDMFPEKEMYEMMFEENSLIEFELASLPYIFLIRMIWMFHCKATAEQIFDAVLRWSKQEKIKEGFLNNKKKYDSVVSVLKEMGPCTEQEFRSSKDQLLKSIFDKFFK